MNMNFFLTQFESGEMLRGFTVTGGISRHVNKLFISYIFSGAPEELVIPEHSDIPCRRNGLWEETCFEFFLAPGNSDQYWEFNLSPSGHWNVYRFTSYRKGMLEEPAFNLLPFSFEVLPDSLILSLEVNLEKLAISEQALDVGISAVIVTTDGNISYWALDHPGPKPDFHRRDSFTIEL